MPSTEIFRLKSTLATMAVVAGAVAVSLPAAANAAGNVLVYNEASETIHPWFKCPAPACNADGSWSFYGTIDADSQFQWDFSASPGDFAFTYTLDGEPAPTDPVNGARKHPVNGARKALFTVDPGTNNVIQIGNKIRALDLNAPGENGKSEQ
jgi:hypothetical protein